VVGGGMPSANVGLRKRLDLYSSLRPVKSVPSVKTRYENVDLVVVRENTEGLYAGLEHIIVPGVVESLKIITEKASTRIARFAWPQEGDVRPQGQHHEAVGRPLPGLRPQGGPRVPGDPVRGGHHRQLLHAAGEGPHPL
jgi:hypothetical protein